MSKAAALPASVTPPLPVPPGGLHGGIPIPGDQLHGAIGGLGGGGGLDGKVKSAQSMGQSMGGKCRHGKRKLRCKDCGGKGEKKCPHGKRKARCKDCGGGVKKCPHNKRKEQCPQCGGSSICEHKRQRYQCKVRLSEKGGGWALGVVWLSLCSFVVVGGM